MDIETLRTYVRKFKEGGVEQLLERNHHEKTSFLSFAQKNELIKHLELNLYRTTQEVVLYVKRAFKVAYSRSGMTKLLHALGFTYKKPKLIPSGIDVQAQEEFIECFERFMQNKKEGDIVVFYDSCHPQYQSHQDYGWIKKGENVLLPNHGKRGRINISGGVDLETGSVVVDFPETVNSKTTLESLRKIEAYYPHANTITVILDNASAHRSVFVREQIKETKLNLVFLPPYFSQLKLNGASVGVASKKITCKHI